MRLAEACDGLQAFERNQAELKNKIKEKFKALDEAHKWLDNCKFKLPELLTEVDKSN